MKSGLLFCFGGLGDLLVALPSIRLLRKVFPEHFLSLVCRAEYGRLLREARVVDVVLPVDDSRWLPLFDEQPQPPEDFRQWLSGFDFIVGWLQRETSRALLRKTLSWPVSNRHWIVYDPQSRIPVSRYFFDQTLALVCDRPGANATLEDCGRLPLLKKDGRERGAPEEAQRVVRPQPFTVIHPGSGSERKCWPLENFLEIIAILHQKEIEGFLITGEAEARMEKEIQGSTLPPGWPWLRRPPLQRLARLLQEAEFYLGNDSGVTHLAAACGTPGLAVFRKDLEIAWRPYGRINVLSDEDISAVTVDSVWKAVSRRLQKK